MSLGRKPRIAVVSPLLPIKRGSHRGHSLYETVIRFAGRAEVEAFCPVTRYPKYFEPRSYQYQRPDHNFQPVGLKVTYLEYGVLPILTRPFNGFLCLNKLLPYLERFKPDLILNSWLYPEGYASMWYGSHHNIPVVHYCVGSDLRRIPDPLTGYYTKQVLRYAAGIIAVSHDLARLAVELGAASANTHAILNGFDQRFFYIGDRAEARGELRLPANRRILLYAGNLKESKGIFDLAKAVALLNEKTEDLHVYMLGEGPDRAAFTKLTDKLGVTNRFTLAGQVPNTAIGTWLAASDIFCLPSHSEGCPNVIIEARACGRPVVATNVGGIPEITGPDDSILVPAKSPSELADAIVEALGRSWEPSKIAAGLSSWDEVADRAFDVCDRALQAGANIGAIHG